MPEKSVLVVEDSASLRALLSDLLQAEGYRVKEAADGREALHAVENELFDLIVTDITMPVMDGVAFVREAKKLPQCSCVPIVVLSSADNVYRLEKAKQAGASSWLSKPFSPAQFREMLNIVLDR